MILTREQMHRTIDNLPESFPIEQLMEQLVFVKKVETGLVQSQKKQINSKEQTKEKLSKWLK